LKLYMDVILELHWIYCLYLLMKELVLMVVEKHTLSNIYIPRYNNILRRKINNMHLKPIKERKIKDGIGTRRLSFCAYEKREMLFKGDLS